MQWLAKIWQFWPYLSHFKPKFKNTIQLILLSWIQPIGYPEIPWLASADNLELSLAQLSPSLFLNFFYFRFCLFFHICLNELVLGKDSFWLFITFLKASLMLGWFFSGCFDFLLINFFFFSGLSAAWSPVLLVSGNLGGCGGLG